MSSVITMMTTVANLTLAFSNSLVSSYESEVPFQTPATAPSGKVTPQITGVRLNAGTPRGNRARPIDGAGVWPGLGEVRLLIKSYEDSRRSNQRLRRLSYGSMLRTVGQNAAQTKAPF